MTTRFRAYKLDTEGAAYSLFDGNTFTLIEARLTDAMIPSIVDEFKQCGKPNYKIQKLHITSWDSDHCSRSELEKILNNFKPDRVEYPGYSPHTDNGIACKKIIESYEAENNPKPDIQEYSPTYLHGLNPSTNWGTQDVLYHPNSLDNENSNNNSIVKLFRAGSFNILSLGDVESPEIAKKLMKGSIIENEVDIMLLAHHGADNGFTSPELLASIKPTVTISASNWGNKFDHPRPVVQNRCENQGCFFATTKRGDVLIVEQNENIYQVLDLYKDSGRVWKDQAFYTKKAMSQK